MTRAALVYVPGLWHQGPESWPLRHRLLADFDLHTCRYASVSWPMSRVCAQLAALVARIDAPVIHFVGHSLGGLVIHRFLAQSPPPQPGRVVLLGAPMAGSVAARGAARHRWLRPLLGHCVAEELLVARRRLWSDPRPLGLIAGTRGWGFGRLFTRFREPNDGIVGLSETRVPGSCADITVPATHFGLLLSAPVARQTGAFLREGRFAAH